MHQKREESGKSSGMVRNGVIYFGKKHRFTRFRTIRTVNFSAKLKRIVLGGFSSSDSRHLETRMSSSVATVTAVLALICTATAAPARRGTTAFAVEPQPRKQPAVGSVSEGHSGSVGLILP